MNNKFAIGSLIKDSSTVYEDDSLGVVIDIKFANNQNYTKVFWLASGSITEETEHYLNGTRLLS